MSNSERAAAAKPSKEKASTPSQVGFSGSLANELVQMRVSEVNLVTIFGQLDEKGEVLVPLIDWQIFGRKAFDEEIKPDEYGETLGSFLLSYDNLAFLLQDIGKDLKGVTDLVARQASCAVPLVPGRMEYALKMLRLAVGHLADSADRLDDLLTRVAVDETNDNPPSLGS